MTGHNICYCSIISKLYTLTFLNWSTVKKLLIVIFVSPAKQKRDICTAFPPAALSSASAAA